LGAAKPRIVVAMSGGVDSSTAAALLREAGHEVVGVTLKLYDAVGAGASRGGRCCTPRDVEDARRVAAMLGFPHYVLDEREAFGRAVIDDFVAEYRAGRTPNPCVRCNEHLKFGPLVRFAAAIGAEALATGHYARLGRRDGRWRLRRARDPDKDQSYFLFGVPEDLLGRVRFPLGELDKGEVRAAARRLGLPNADKPDSQQICFIADGDHKGFVEARGGGPPGEVVDEAGRVIGRHAGTHHFTIGQRKGVPAVGGGDKRFVLRIDVASARVHVGPRHQLARREIRVGDVRWLGAPRPAGAARVRCAVQIRHRAIAHAATLTAATNTTADVRFDEPVEAAAPGQAAVFFGAEEEVLGGGWIEG
jgi:tRNA-specific 2-thiouridylase